MRRSTVSPFLSTCWRQSAPIHVRERKVGIPPATRPFCATVSRQRRADSLSTAEAEMLFLRVFCATVVRWGTITKTAWRSPLVAFKVGRHECWWSFLPSITASSHHRFCFVPFAHPTHPHRSIRRARYLYVPIPGPRCRQVRIRMVKRCKGITIPNG